MTEAGHDRISIVQGDITTLAVGAIVNAANSTLLGGGGVDGAIHRAAGPGLYAECVALHGCATGEARITGGHWLPARHVIHVVGPVWHGGHRDEPESLASCYRNALRLAHEYGVRTVAFPCISTGAFGYPPAAACDVAVRTVTEWLLGHDMPEQVVFCCYLPEDQRLYTQALGRADAGG